MLAGVRQQPIICRLPVVVLTSSQESTEVDRAYELGASSYLQKPVSYDAPNALISTLNICWLQLNQIPSMITT
ncbi:hypothetical protein C7271_09990 [filamentous cyanobacterium CCP5]|nr:hypothetical protein C7271_09990 [filamentous cyanobacterium CCP5]